MLLLKILFSIIVSILEKNCSKLNNQIGVTEIV